MPAVESEPPAEVVDAARAASKRGSRLTRWLRRSGRLVTPLHVFVVELNSLVEPEALHEIARPVGWRFMAPTGTEPVVIEIAERNLDVQIERSPFVRGVEHVLRAARHEPSLADTSFEPRMLRIPEAHITAVWFTRED